jgi:hypothetical protein
MAPFGAPRTMQGSPDMLWRPRRPFGGGLASHPKIQAPHAAAATAIGFPMRPSDVVVALQRRRFAERPGWRGGWTGSWWRVFGRAGSGWRARSRHRRIPPVASLCLADRGVGFAVRRVGSTRGRHPLAFATSGGSSLRRLVRGWGGACSETCFGRRQRQGRSAPIRRRQRRRQGVCRSSERKAPAFAALSRSAREGVGCTVRGTYVVWWSHQLRNTTPTPFLYQGHFLFTTKNRPGAVVEDGFISPVLALY